jgi:cell division protein FtsZ
MQDAFATADTVLVAGVQGITDLITTPGLINLDFADVKSVMSGAGAALMGIGSARGADRAIKAAEAAVASPLLEASIEGARGVLVSVQGGSNLGLFETDEAVKLVQEAVHPEANIIFGTVIDDTLGDEIRITVIAAGFDGGEPKRLVDSSRFSNVAADAETGVLTTSRPADAHSVELVQDDDPFVNTGSQPRYAEPDYGSAFTEPARTSSVAYSLGLPAEDGELDVPDFLRH